MEIAATSSSGSRSDPGSVLPLATAANAAGFIAMAWWVIDAREPAHRDLGHRIDHVPHDWLLLLAIIVLALAVVGLICSLLLGWSVARTALGTD